MTEEFGGIDSERGIERDGSDNAGLAGGEDSAVLIGQTAIAVAQPAPGESLSIDAAAGQRYVIEFSPDAAQVRVQGNDLILEFADGGSIVFANLGLVVDAADEPVFEVAGQPISSAVIFALGEGTLETAAAPTVVGTGETRYDDDTGELIDLLDAQPVIPPTELEFRLIELEPTEVLAGEEPAPLIPPVDFDVNVTANFIESLAAAGLTFAPGLGFGGGSSGTVLDFNAFLVAGSAFTIVPAPVSEDGFTVEAPSGLVTLGSDLPSFLGDASLIINNLGETATLTADDGSAFDLGSIDLSGVTGDENIFTSGEIASSITFTGLTSGGATVTQTFTLDGVFGTETFNFNSDFDDVVSVAWDQDATFPGSHQFDNIVIGPVGGAAGSGAPTPPGTPLNLASPTGLELPDAVTAVGGVVLDMVGLNGTRIVTQLPASELFVGFFDDGVPVAFRGDPGTIGIQEGFTPELLNLLGGGLAEVAIRITVFDGDTAVGNFDDGDNTLLLNGVNFGDWTDVTTIRTDGTGSQIGSEHPGFQNNTLDTGWFFSNDPATLASFFGNLLGSNDVTFQLDDTDPFDNFFDFTQGVDGGLVDVGTGPVVTGGQQDDSGLLYEFQVGEAKIVLDNIHGTDVEDVVTTQFTITSLPTAPDGTVTGLLFIDRGDDNVIEEIYGEGFAALPADGIQVQTGDSVFYYLPKSDFADRPESVSFNYFTVDSDGLDSLGDGPATITIELPDPVPTVSATDVSVDEDDIDGGEGGRVDVPGEDLNQLAGSDTFNLGDPPFDPDASQSPPDGFQPTTVTGTITANFSFDEPGTATFTPATVAALQALNLTSSTNDEALGYTLSNGDRTLTATTSDGTVFTLEIAPASSSGDFEYSFELIGSINHPLTDDPATTDVETKFEDPSILPIQFQVTDLNGDSATGTFNVSIEDDVPTIAFDGGEGQFGEPGALKLWESDIFDGGEGATATEQFTVVYGADGPESDPNGTPPLALNFLGALALADGPNAANETEFAYDTDGTTANPALTSRGETVLVAADANNPTVIRGFIDNDGSGDFNAGDDLVFSAAVQVSNGTFRNNGELRFELFRQLDHPDEGEVMEDDNIRFEFSVTVTDDDGDSDTLSFTVDVDDDGPRVFQTEAAIVDEDGLPERGDGGNEGIPGGPGDIPDPQPAPGGDGDEATFAGNLGVDFGTDQPGDISFAALDGQAVVDTGGNPVLSHGQPLTYSWNADTHILSAVTPGGTGSGDGTSTGTSTGLPGPSGNNLVAGLGGPAGFGENTFAPNDDGSVEVDITSVFGAAGMNFFGTSFTSIFINNNGNITFDSDQSTFTPFAITGSTGNPIIAPYFADVDTRPSGDPIVFDPDGNSTGTNLVYWDMDTAAGIMTITWDDVGFFGEDTSKTNAFQLRLFDNGGGDFSFEFRYEDINWTTGDASSGSGGLGGVISRAGWSSGDGVNFFELPQSGDQAQMLALEETGSNVDVPGLWQFGVVEGGVVDVPTGAGETIFEIEITDVQNGDYTLTLLNQVDHPLTDDPSTTDVETAFEDNIDLLLPFLVTDFDGDTADGILPVTINDDSPARTGETVMGTVEEEQLDGGNEDTTAIPDLDEDTSIPSRDGPPTEDFGITTDVVTGSLVPLVDFGADGPSEDGGFSFSSDTSGLPGDLTSGSEPIGYGFTDDGLLVGFTTGAAFDATGADQSNWVFKLSLDTDGGYTFTLLDVLDHAAPPAGTAEENILEIDFSSVVVATDFDGDSITLSEGDFTVKAIDDVPVIGDGTATVAHDETPGVDADADDTADPLPAAIAALGLTPIGAAQSPAGQLDYSFGADGPGQTLLSGANGEPLDSVDSGLTRSSDGASIFLFSDPADPQLVLGKALLSFETAGVDGDATQETITFAREHNLSTGQMVIYSFLGSGVGGLTDDGEFFAIVVDANTIKLAASAADALAGTAIDLTPPPIDADAVHFLEAADSLVLAVYLDTNGAGAGDDTLWVAQFDAVEHPIAGDGTGGSHDETVSVADKIFLTVIDFDGDSVTAPNAITVEIQDDGPKLTGQTAMGTVEEEHLADGNEDTFPAADQDTLDPDGAGPLGDDFNATTTVTSGSLAGLVNFGADQPGTFSLSTDTSGLPALTSNGEPVLYGFITSVLVGFVDVADPPGDSREGVFDSDDRLVFSLHLNPNGTYIFELRDQLDHHPVALADNAEGILPIDFSSVVIATDADGDTVALTEGTFTIDVIDDTPLIDGAEGASVTHDETPGIDPDADDTANPLPAGLAAAIALLALTPIGSAQSEGPVVSVSIGADQPGGLSLTDAAGALLAGADSGLERTSDGLDIFLFTDADDPQLVYGRAGTGAVDAETGDVVFLAFLDETDNTMWVTQFEAIEHPNILDNDETVSVVNEVYVTATDEDGDAATAQDAVTLAFQDDGPSVGNITMINDETFGIGDDTPSDDVEFAEFNASDLPGDLVDFFDFIDGAMINVSKKPVAFDYGADGPGGIALDDVVDGADSGLVDTGTGRGIFLFNGPDNTVVGVVVSEEVEPGSIDFDVWVDETASNLNSTGIDLEEDLGGLDIAFVGVMGDPDDPSGPDNESSADLWFVQYRAIQHDNPFDPDEVNPEPSGTSVGPADVITFEGLAAGTYDGTDGAVDGVFAVTSAGGQTILVSAINAGLTGNAAVVFDSANPSGSLFGMGSENSDFGGPGIDEDGDPNLGGNAGSPFQNDTALGKTLIVGRTGTLNDRDGDGLIDDPSVQGKTETTIVFDFSAAGAVLLDSVTVMDLGGFVIPDDPSSGLQSMTFNFYDAAVGGTLLGSVSAPHTGSNGVAAVDLGGVADAVRMEVVIKGSGAVDNIVFRPAGEQSFEDEFLNLTYTVTDGDLDTVQGTATITIEDDGPTAVNDTAFLDTAEDEVTGGNVFDNDNIGVDGATVEGEPVTLFRYIGEDSGGNPVELSAAAGSEVTTANGGQLLVEPNGDWAYLAGDGDGISEAGYVENVTYVIEDGDGDTDSATLQIRVVLDPDFLVEAGTGDFGGDTGDDFLSGDSTDNEISGDDGNDLLFGNGGGDTLSGDGGDDQLYGGPVGDFLVGGLGDDQLYGGGAADTFVYFLSDDEGTDIISDFSVEEGDRLLFLDVVDVGGDPGVDFGDVFDGPLTKVGSTVNVTLTSGTVLVIEDVNNAIEDLDDLIANSVLIV